MGNVSPEFKLTLRRVVESDFDWMYEMERDEESCMMAAFIAPPQSPEEFAESRRKRLASLEDLSHTIEVNGEPAGGVLCYPFEDGRAIGYWIKREFWGKGVASEAVKLFVRQQANGSPFYAMVAFDNLGSRKVLERNGFKYVRTETAFAKARDAEIEEHIFVLHQPM